MQRMDCVLWACRFCIQSDKCYVKHCGAILQPNPPLRYKEIFHTFKTQWCNSYLSETGWKGKIIHNYLYAVQYNWLAYLILFDLIDLLLQSSFIPYSQQFASSFPYWPEQLRVYCKGEKRKDTEVRGNTCAGVLKTTRGESLWSGLIWQAQPQGQPLEVQLWMWRMEAIKVGLIKTASDHCNLH